MNQWMHEWIQAEVVSSSSSHQDLIGNLPVCVFAKPATFKHHNQLPSCLLYLWGNWGSEKLIALFSATQLIKGWGKIKIGVYLTSKSMLVQMPGSLSLSFIADLSSPSFGLFNYFFFFISLLLDYKPLKGKGCILFISASCTTPSMTLGRKQILRHIYWRQLNRI